MQVEALFSYPIKSGAGHSSASVELDSLGFQEDRRYLVTYDDGRFVSARTWPAQQRLVWKDNCLVFDGASSPEVAWGESQDVSIWKRQQPALEAQAEVNQWLSERVGKPVRFWQLPPASTQHFGDSRPIMVLFQETLDAISRVLGRPLPALQFRPNVLVSGGQAFAEDQLGVLTLGEVILEPVKPCTRCVMINLTPGDDRYPREKAVSEALRSLNGDFVAGHHFAVRQTGTLQVGQRL